MRLLATTVGLTKSVVFARQNMMYCAVLYKLYLGN